ncbi:putative glutamine transport system permease protein [Symbiobacterium terraclitae]|uniref:Glutamine transport system permease protein n=1 Tax=Symbiobacterium terraclitae TaxID=557451 RepID=A0ABS4JPC8_9FIRM|nr:amino acid ABC transporter permease [Symbiobacterium terraclitae]MBP2017375.1 putative glutamine transport system permease protein [Symbiobacterium terraclitae]
MMEELAVLAQWHNVRFMAEGLLITLRISFFTIVFSFILGTLLGVMRYSGHRLLASLAAVYIESFRASPLILLILLFRFTMPLKPVNSGTLAMTLFTAAIVGEIVRGGLNSVDKGQWEAARSQGFTWWQTMRHIVLPQALRKMIPPLTGQFITVVKDTSYVWVVGVQELTGKGVIILGQHGSTVQFFAIFGMIGLIYYILCLGLNRLGLWQERRMSWLTM